MEPRANGGYGPRPASDAHRQSFRLQIMGHESEVQPSAAIREDVTNARRIVIKVGTNVVMRDDGRLALSQLYGIAESVAKLRESGRDILMVSSGAVGLGMERIGLANRPTELSL